jgi:hypothetical protein
MNENELINTINSLYSQRKQLQSIQTASNQEEIDAQLNKINKDIASYMNELEKFSSDISLSSINIEFG